MDAREFNAWMLRNKAMHKLESHGDYWFCSQCGSTFSYSVDSTKYICPSVEVEINVRIRQEGTELPERGIEL